MKWIHRLHGILRQLLIYKPKRALRTIRNALNIRIVKKQTLENYKQTIILRNNCIDNLRKRINQMYYRN